jgi:hypothetical protein
VLLHSVDQGRRQQGLDQGDAAAAAVRLLLLLLLLYHVPQGCKVLMDAEVCPSLLTAMRNYFNMLEVRVGSGFRVQGSAAQWTLLLLSPLFQFKRLCARA